ncbi:MAG: PilZ domain-containing protein [Candidatus Hydrogenedentes bacterium]|nr:PilZ domain-containing protein [Candidatus Hydrogenedentota bacterium]
MTEGRNRREFTRIPIKVGVEVRCDSGVVLTGVVSDLSLNGLLLAASEGAPVGARCDMRLRLDGGGEILTVEAKGQITRSDAEGMAITFDQVDADSFEHLRNLVLYNSSDPDRVSDEFLGHLGIKPR